MMHKFLSQFDTLLFYVLSISLANIHIFLAIIFLIPTGIYNTYKLFDYLKHRKDEKIKRKTENHFNDDDFID